MVRELGGGRCWGLIRIVTEAMTPREEKRGWTALTEFSIESKHWVDYCCYSLSDYAVDILIGPCKYQDTGQRGL